MPHLPAKMCVSYRKVAGTTVQHETFNATQRLILVIEANKINSKDSVMTCKDMVIFCYILGNIRRFSM